MLKENRQPSNEWQSGVALAFALNFIHFIFAPVKLRHGYFPAFIGVSQLIYIFPITAYYRYKKRNDMVKGLLIGASITFLLNASCVALMK